MNLIERIHGRSGKERHNHHDDNHAHQSPIWVRYYDWITNIITFGKIAKMHQGTLSLVDLAKGDSVLDIGCGTGKLILAAEQIIGHEGTAVGLDVEKGMIAQAKQHARQSGSHAQFEVASIDQIPYPDNSFDVVTSTLVYHHLTEAQKEAGFAELYRVLKPNGRLLIADLNPNQRSLATSLPGHNQLEREDHVRTEVVTQMKNNGFINIEAGEHPLKTLSYAIGVKK